MTPFTRTASALLGLIVAAILLAAPSPASASAAAPNCPANTFCLFTGANHGGGVSHLAGRAVGTCGNFSNGPYRSYSNNSTIEGYLFSGSGCTGSARAVTRGSWTYDLNFWAYSFRYACVSC